MLKNFVKIFGGDPNKKTIEQLGGIAKEINALEPKFEALSDEELRAKKDEFKARLDQIIGNVEDLDEKQQFKVQQDALDEILPEAFAVVREASKRAIGQRQYDVQLIGGVALHRGSIAEMRTGEGKTLVATMPIYLNALLGKGIHLITVNDYLARRDARWMAPIFHMLGLSVGVLQMAASTENGKKAFIIDFERESPHEDQHHLRMVDRAEAYAADVTYGTNSEFGFDYLRDNMTMRLSDRVQRGHHYAIIDEVDNVLIDEARTPLIISGPASGDLEWYGKMAQVVKQLKPEDYEVNEKDRAVAITEVGLARVEQLLNQPLMDPDRPEDVTPEQARLRGHLEQALRAQFLFHRNKEYLVQAGKVVIVDDFTGRLMPGRRWSDGLHQAVEAKEKVKIERENQTLATVTFQNYFRKYKKLAGMTGTADTEAEEFAKIYKLDVMVAPTNRPLKRVEEPDTVYRTEREKYEAIVTDIIEKQQEGRPILVGTVSIEKSERLSKLLKLRGIKHVVLNAKFHAQEAEIVAQAGRKHTVTIATNMAGRGTDILLGGNPEFMARQQTLADQIAERLPKGQEKFVDDADFVYFFHLDSFYRVKRPEYERIFAAYKKSTDVEHDEVVALGGLHIIATERHEARRIDNQLRGRAGRQGDPGSSRFYLSLEDDLMRIFGSDRISGLMQRLGMEDGVPIEHKMVTKAIERAQKQVEAQNFSVRKHLLEYDDVMNKQRESVYRLRRQLLEGKVQYDPEEGEEAGEVVDTREYLIALAEALLEGTAERYTGKDIEEEERDYGALRTAVAEIYGLDPAELDAIEVDGLTPDQISDALWPPIIAKYENKEKLVPVEILRKVERDIMLQIVDSQWKDHLRDLDHLKEGIGLRGYGQRDPLVEYKKESFELFTAMKDRIEEEIVKYLWRLTPVLNDDGGEGAMPVRQPAARRPPPLTLSGPSTAAAASPFGAIRGGGTASAVAEP